MTLTFGGCFSWWKDKRMDGRVTLRSVFATVEREIDTIRQLMYQFRAGPPSWKLHTLRPIVCPKRYIVCLLLILGLLRKESFRSEFSWLRRNTLCVRSLFSLQVHILWTRGLNSFSRWRKYWLLPSGRGDWQWATHWGNINGFMQLNASTGVPRLFERIQACGLNWFDWTISS